MIAWKGSILRDATGGARQGVYFLKPRGRALVKIGHGSPLRLRISQIQCGCPEVLDALLVVRGGGQLERSIHSLLAGGGYRGEWFHHTPDIDWLIECLAVAADPLQLVQEFQALTDQVFLQQFKARSALAQRLVESGAYPFNSPPIRATVLPLSSAANAA